MSVGPLQADMRYKSVGLWSGWGAWEKVELWRVSKDCRCSPPWGQGIAAFQGWRDKALGTEGLLLTC